MKKTTQTLLLALVCCMALVLAVACNDAPKLATPEVSVTESGLASWQAVENATEYAYKLDGGDEKTTTATQLQLENGQSIEVKAVGDGTNYTDSDYSVAKTWTAATNAGPVITVNPETVEINANDDIDLMFGVTVTDATDDNPELVIADDNDFDNKVEGTYTITYKATNKSGAETTATRTVVVNKALSNLDLEVRTNYLGETKWQGTKVSFLNKLFVTLSTDATLENQSGVFYNSSDSEITLTVSGSYGCAAIINKNGVVIEGRDGANGKLVNAENPTRSGSSVKTITVGGEAKNVADAFAAEMKIPAEGYAIVIQAGYAGTSADTDGRGFMNYNVIYSYGNIVRLVWADTSEVITPYVDQAPSVSGNTDIVVKVGDDFDLETEILNGLVVTDDEGKFDGSVTIDNSKITITDEGNFDINTEGAYTITMTVSDGTNTRTFTRIVDVRLEKFTIAVNGNEFSVAKESVAVDQELTSKGSYALIVFTPSYTGTLGFDDSFGVCVVLDRYGKIVRTYDGANGWQYDADNKVPGSSTVPCSSADYDTIAFESRQDGEYLIYATNLTANNADGGSRKWVLSNCRTTIGMQMTVTDITFDKETDDKTLTVNGKTFTAEEGKWAYNSTEITDKNAAAYSMIIFDKNFTGTFSTNSYGAAIVLDKYGKLVKVYDGANLGYYTSEGKADTVTYTVSTYATVAFSELEDGELLIIFPNDGTNGTDSPRTFALGLRTDGSIGQLATLTGFTFEQAASETNYLTIGENKFEIVPEKIAVNTTTSAVGDYDMYVFTSTFAGTIGFTNGWGQAFVMDKDNKIIRIYDGVSGKLYTKENTSGETLANSDYLTKALSSLKANEWLLVGANNGDNQNPRSFMSSNRTLDATVTLGGVDFTLGTKDLATITVGTKSFYTAEVAVNAEVSGVGEYDFAVYTYGYSGVVLVNGWSECFVFDADGKITKIYDGVNNKWYNADNTSGVARTDDMYVLASASKDALLNLNPGETLVVGLNGGLGSNRARAFLVSNRTYGATMTLSGVSATASTETISYMQITIDGKLWLQDSSKVAVDAAYTGTPAFAIYHYGYTGTLISGGWGVAMIVDEATGTVVAIYDGTNGKLFNSEYTSGAQNVGCTASGYITEAFAALQEGQYLIIAPNGGTTGNTARGFLYGKRTLGIVLSYALPDSSEK